MKQTIEEAAKESIHKHYNCNGCITPFDCNECGADEYKEGFIAGAEWEAKQSPWISVDERYPDYDNSIPLDNREAYIVRVETGSAEVKIRYTIAWMTSRYHFNVEMDWVRVTHWMPMPAPVEYFKKEKGD